MYAKHTLAALALSAAAATAAQATDIDTVTMGQYTFDLSSADIIDNADGSVTASGNVAVNIAGFTLNLADADLELEEFDGAWEVVEGDIDALGGNLPALDALHSLTNGGTDLSVGFASGDALPFDAPVDPNGFYMYLNLSAGASIQVGDATIEPPIGANLSFLIDPYGPTLYLNAGGLFPKIGVIEIDEVGIGISANDGLHWTPVNTWYNWARMGAGADGNVYLKGAASIGMGDVAEFSVSGDQIADIDFAALEDGRLHDAIKALAANGTVGLGFDIGFANVGFELGSASVLYKRDEFIAASGTVDLDDIGLPGLSVIDFDSGANAAFYTNGTDLDFRAQAHADLSSGVSMDALVHVTEGGASIDATVDLGATTFDGSGTINANGNWSISATQSFTKKAGIFKLKGSATATVGNNGFSTSSALHGCVKANKWRRSKVNGSASINNGKLKVSAKFSGKKLCDSLTF